MVGGSLSVEARREVARRVLAPVKGHPKQWAALQMLRTSRLLCVQANRRAGKTYGIVRYLLARCVAKTTKVVILTHFLAQPTKNALDNQRPDCMVELIRSEGLSPFVKIHRTPAGIKSIRFAWGSVIDVIEASNAGAVEKPRGTTGDVFWADEAQSQPFLATMIARIVGPMLAETKASVILSGTPGTETDSFFRRVSLGLSSWWAKAAFFSWDNPVFGSTPEARWSGVLDDSIKLLSDQYGIPPEDLEFLRTLTEAERVAISDARDTDLRPEVRKWVDAADHDLLREFFGRWITAQSEYVFNWHRPGMYWCRESDRVPGDLPAAATMAARLQLLPFHPLRRWYAAIGVDLGVQDPSAWVVWVYANNHPTAYELWSEKRQGLSDTQVFARLEELVDEVKALGLQITGVIADNKGSRKGVGMDWDLNLRARVPSGVRIPRNMRTLDRVRALNLDLGAGRIKVVKGSPLDIEGLNLKWKPQDPDRPMPPTPWKERKVTLPDGRQDRPGDHALDATLYALQDLDHIWNTEAEPPATVEEAMARERERHLKRELQKSRTSSGKSRVSRFGRR